MKRDLRAQLRVEIMDLANIPVAACARIFETDRRLSVDEPRVDFRAGRVDHLRAGRDADVRADAFDDAVADDDGPAIDRRPCHRNDFRVRDREHAARRRGHVRRLTGGAEFP